MNIRNLENESRKIVKSLGAVGVLEYMRDLSTAPGNAVNEYFMAKMGIHRRQVLIQLNGQESFVVQAGAMQWMTGQVEMTSGVRGAGDLLGKMLKGAVTKETAVKPEYRGQGIVALEPTYKYIILQDVAAWPGGITLEDGMFLASSGGVRHNIVSRRNLSSAVLGNEGLFNLSLSGSGVAVLESNVPEEELMAVDLQNEELKIDGSLAVCWSSGLNFSVEMSSRSILGSAVSGEGLVNVYRGTGRVLMSPVAPTWSLLAATRTGGANPAK